MTHGVSGKDAANRLPVSSQPLHHWRSSAEAAPRPKPTSAWEFAAADPRAAHIAALGPSRPGAGPSGPVITSYGARATAASVQQQRAAPAERATAAARPTSAAALRPSSAYRSAAAGSAQYASLGASKPSSGYYGSSAALAAASGASAAPTVRSGPATTVARSGAPARPTSATLIRTGMAHGSSGASGTTVLRPSTAAPNRFATPAGAYAALSRAPQQAYAPHQAYAPPPAQPPPAQPQPQHAGYEPHGHSAASGASHQAYAPPQHQRRADPADDGPGAAVRRALAQPAWSASELQQRSQYPCTIADDVQRHYSFGKALGSGSFGEVREAVHRLTDTPVAIKKIDKLKAGTARLRTRIAMEVRLHQRLRHPHIVQVYEVIEGARNVYLVMEMLPTTLLALLKEKKVLSEAEARPLFAQLLAALAHCHKHSIVHRDIKLENLLLDASRASLKLCDFGFAVMTRSNKLTVACGSPSYNCPEIVAKRQYHGVPADVWSSGVLLYVMLVGAFPFAGSTHESLNRRIMAGQYRCPPELSPAAADLIRRCLQVEPERRASLAEMADHPWLREGAPIPRPLARPEILEADVHATLETLGLSRADSREAYELLRRGERSHTTVTFELLAAKRQARAAAAAATARRPHALNPAGVAPSAAAAAAAASAGRARAQSAGLARLPQPGATAEAAATESDDDEPVDAPARPRPSATSHSNAHAHADQRGAADAPSGPAVGYLRATVVKPQLVDTTARYTSERPIRPSTAAPRATHPALIGR